MRLLLSIVLLFILLVTGGCAPGNKFDRSLNRIVQPYKFSILGWELANIWRELGQPVFSRSAQETSDSDLRMVASYFTPSEQSAQQKQELKDDALPVLVKQIADTLAEQGITNPASGLIPWKGIFPPIKFRVESPPNLLVISPRDRIERVREVILVQDLSLDEMKVIESRIDELGYSSLVVRLGGIAATYPPFITDNASLKFTINAAFEEWLHQYLTFTPLGFAYVLHLTGVSKNSDIATMNETVAGMVSDELGSILYKKYYSHPGEDENNLPQHENTRVDFNSEMREIRILVDTYLAEGKIEKAEKFMEEKRQYLEKNGYYIRKLNQAYFAFYGTYASSPASIDPIGQKMKELRSQTQSLKDFLNTASSLSNSQQLADKLN